MCNKDGDLISRSALLERAFIPDDKKVYVAVVVTEDIKHATAVDAVEVVRCRDCAMPHNKFTGCPNLNGLIPPPDFYCAKGKRRDGVADKLSAVERRNGE